MDFIMVANVFIKFLCISAVLFLGACNSTPKLIYASQSDVLKNNSQNLLSISNQKIDCASINSTNVGIVGNNKNWTLGAVACYVKPVYASSLNLKSYWNGEACIDGLAYGAGAALWCQSDVTCGTSTHQPVIIAVGVANKGLLSNCPVVVRSSSTVFLGKLSEQGYNDIGKVIVYDVKTTPKYVSETFIGKFKNGNDYASGAMRYRNRTYISSDFGKGNLVRGEAFIIEPDGTAYMAKCDGLVCQKTDVSLYLNNRDTQLIEKAFEDGFLNAAEKEAIRQLIIRIVPRAASGPMAILLTVLLELIPSI